MYRANKTLSIVVLGIACLAFETLAQARQAKSWNYKVELFGNVGYGKFYLGDTTWGKGLDYGGGIGVRPFSRRLHGLGFELQLAHIADKRSPSPDIASRLSASMVSGNVLYHFLGHNMTQPYLLFGLANVKAKYSYSCGACIFNQDPETGQLIPIPYKWETDGSKLGINLGAGLKIAITRHFSIRPEFLLTDTTAGQGWNWDWLKVQISAGVHF